MTHLIQAKEVLSKYWNYPDFRGEQAAIIEAVLKGEDVIALLATGAGKSICYQVPALVLDGLTIVVSPLIALMEDQVQQLKDRGIAASFLHAGMTRDQIDLTIDNAIYGKTKFLYLSPERIHTDMFMHRVDKLPVSLIAIDEAHCISQWGHDFRPAYRELGSLRTMFPNAIFTAFTATATDHILSEIEEVLLFEKSKKFTSSFRKKNLQYSVIETKDKFRELQYLIDKLPGIGIIYAGTRKRTVEISKMLKSLGKQSDFYHAGLSYKVRKEKQLNWLSRKDLIMVSTNAFGMGIDKSDLRYVIHMDIPTSLEAYYQEAGRAGRDGEQAYAIMLYELLDINESLSQFERSQTTAQEVSFLYDQLGRFLQIPIGGNNDGLGLTFNISLFLEKIKWPYTKFEAGMKILEKHDLILTNESSFKSSKLQILINKEQLMNLTKTANDFSKLLTYLLRNHEGLLSHATKIDERRIAKALQFSTKDVVGYLRQMHERGFATYEESHSEPEIFWLKPRFDENNIGVDESELKKLRQVKEMKLENMLDYIQREDCRENVLINYFSEKVTRVCGQCDVCRGSLKDVFSAKDAENLYRYLQRKLTKETELDKLLHWWPHNKRKKVSAILSLLENENKIRIERGFVSLNTIS